MPLSAMDAAALGLGLPPGLVALEPSRHTPPALYPANKEAGYPWPHDPLSLEAGHVYQAISRPMMVRHVADQNAHLPCSSAPFEWELPMPSSLFGVTKKAAAPVTFIIKNIPSRCSSNDLLAAIQASGFRGSFEFLYLPLKPQKFAQNRGYAFVGFQDRWQARVFCELLSGARVARTSTKEIRLEEAVEHRTMEEVQLCTKTEVIQSEFGAVLILKGTKCQTTDASAFTTMPIRL